jgi:hypothetical protein
MASARRVKIAVQSFAAIFPIIAFLFSDGKFV